MSNNTKQTAVEWLFHQLWDEPKDKFTYYAILKQAKEMEKQQIESAYYTGATNFSEHSTKAVRWSKQYYNEEYGGNNEQQ